MIQNKKDYLFYLDADRIALSVNKPVGGGKLLKFNLKQLLFPNEIWRFERTMRRLEYVTNCKKGLLKKIQLLFLKARYRRLSFKLGFSIPINVCGPGLALAHYGSIVINPTAVIGRNCLIHSGVNIGTQAGYSDRAPKIGDFCYIGPGAKLFGGITIPAHTAIGANAVVNKSFEEEYTSIAGVPAIVKKTGVETLDFIRPAVLMIKYGYDKLPNICGIPALELKEVLKADNRIYKY